MKNTKATITAVAAILLIIVVSAIGEAMTAASVPENLRASNKCYEVDGNVFCPARGEEK